MIATLRTNDTMKRLAPLLLLLLLFGCTGEPEHVSPTEFRHQYEWVGKAQSVRAVDYLGQRDGKAFIRVQSMSMIDQKKWKSHVIYVELSELEPAFRDSLPTTEMKDPR
jgi:hypothetical protein